MNRRELLFVILKGWLIAIPTYAVLLLVDSDKFDPDAELAETVAMKGMWAKDPNTGWILPENSEGIVLAMFLDPEGASNGMRFAYEMAQPEMIDKDEWVIQCFGRIAHMAGSEQPREFTKEETVRIVTKICRAFRIDESKIPDIVKKVKE